MSKADKLLGIILLLLRETARADLTKASNDALVIAEGYGKDRSSYNAFHDGLAQGQLIAATQLWSLVAMIEERIA